MWKSLKGYGGAVVANLPFSTQAANISNNLLLGNSNASSSSSREQSLSTLNILSEDVSDQESQTGSANVADERPSLYADMDTQRAHRPLGHSSSEPQLASRSTPSRTDIQLNRDALTPPLNTLNSSPVQKKKEKGEPIQEKKNDDEIQKNLRQEQKAKIKRIVAQNKQQMERLNKDLDGIQTAVNYDEKHSEQVEKKVKRNNDFKVRDTLQYCFPMQRNLSNIGYTTTQKAFQAVIAHVNMIAAEIDIRDLRCNQYFEWLYRSCFSMEKMADKKEAYPLLENLAFIANQLNFNTAYFPWFRQDVTFTSIAMFIAVALLDEGDNLLIRIDGEKGNCIIKQGVIETILKELGLRFDQKQWDYVSKIRVIRETLVKKSLIFKIKSVSFGGVYATLDITPLSREHHAIFEDYRQKLDELIDFRKIVLEGDDLQERTQALYHQNILEKKFKTNLHIDTHRKLSRRALETYIAIESKFIGAGGELYLRSLLSQIKENTPSKLDNYYIDQTGTGHFHTIDTLPSRITTQFSSIKVNRDEGEASGEAEDVDKSDRLSDQEHIESDLEESSSPCMPALISESDFNLGKGKSINN